MKSNTADSGPLPDGSDIPEALYSCSNRYCAQDVSYYADQLYWYARQKRWVCENCFGDLPDSPKRGIALEGYIKTMQITRKHFVTFLSPGTFFNEETTKPIPSWDVKVAVRMSRKIVERYGAKPFAFVFSTCELSWKDLGLKTTKESGRYFLGGRVLTLEEVKKEMPNESILIGNMERNKIRKVVVNENSWRCIQPLESGDIVLHNVL